MTRRLRRMPQHLKAFPLSRVNHHACLAPALLDFHGSIANHIRHFRRFRAYEWDDFCGRASCRPAFLRHFRVSDFLRSRRKKGLPASRIFLPESLSSVVSNLFCRCLACHLHLLGIWHRLVYQNGRPATTSMVREFTSGFFKFIHHWSGLGDVHRGSRRASALLHKFLQQ